MRADGAFRVATVTDKQENTRNVFAMHRRFAALLPDYLAAMHPHKCNEQYNSVTYTNTGAFVEGFTAGATEIGRSGTRQGVHVSETAFHPIGHKNVISMMGSVPPVAGTFVLSESTANSYDPLFQPEWFRVMERTNGLCADYGANDQYDLLFNLSGWGDKPDRYGETHPDGYWDGGYFPVFIPSNIIPEYRRDPRLERLNESNLTRLERSLIESHKVDLWWLAWRRFVIREEFKGLNVYADSDPKVLIFQQEYPLTWEESFVTTSRSVFSPATITEMLGYTYALSRETYWDSVSNKECQKIQPTDLRWRVSPIYNSNGVIVNKDRLKSVATPCSGSELLIYKNPDTRELWANRYYIGVDIAEGLAQGDYSVAKVWDKLKQEFVALFRTHSTPYDFANYLALLSVHYQNAWLFGELNNNGISVVQRLLTFTDRLVSRPDMTGGTDRTNPHSYWMRTGEASKSLIIGALEQMVLNKPKAFPFLQSWREKQTFVRNKHGQMGADGKKQDPSIKNFDDTVIAEGYALYGAQLGPNMYKSMERDRIGKLVASKSTKPMEFVIPDNIDSTKVW